MSSLALKRAMATALAGASIASATGAATVAAMPDVPPPPSSIAAPAGEDYAELRSTGYVAPPQSSLAAPAGKEYEDLRAAAQPANPPSQESQPVVDEASPQAGFDLPSAAIGAAVGGALVIALVAAAGLVRRRPLTRRHGTAGA